MTRRPFLIRLVLTRLLPAILVFALSTPFWIGASGRWLVADDGPAKADAVLVLAGDYSGRRLRKGTELLKQGYVPKVFVSGPSEHFGQTEDQLAIALMVREGANADWYIGLPSDASSTLDEARLLLPVIRKHGVKKLLLVTSNYHTRRSGRIFRRAAPDLDVLYVPIGQGSGICGCILARDLLGRKTEIVGVQSTEAPSYALSFAAGKVVNTNSSNTRADGMATRNPDADALAIILKGASHIVQVTDDEIGAAIRAYWTDTHNLAEGAGAAALAAALSEKSRLAGKRVGLILSGGNIDFDLFQRWVGTDVTPARRAVA